MEFEASLTEHSQLGLAVSKGKADLDAQLIEAFWDDLAKRVIGVLTQHEAARGDDLQLEVEVRWRGLHRSAAA